MENFSQPLAIFYENVSNNYPNNYYNNNFSLDDYQYEYTSHDNSSSGSNITSAFNTNKNLSSLNDTDIIFERVQEETDYILLDFIIQGIILTATCILGAIGNTWSVIIFTRMRRKSSFTAFLIGLSFCDAVLVYTSILLFGLPAIFNYLHIAQWYIEIFPFIVFYVYPVSSAAQTGSVYFTLGITVERYFAVCRPLQSKCSRFLAAWKRGVYVASALIVFSILFNIPKWWEYEMKTEVQNNVTTYSYNVTRLREDPRYIKYYVNYAYLIVMFAFPIVMLIVFNSVIYAQIQTTNKLRRRLSTSQSTENSLALILICVVVIFLLCDVLPLVNNIMEHYFGYVYNPLIYAGNFLVAFNSSANFFIYYVCGKTFRQHFWKTVKAFLCCCFFNESSDSSSSVYYVGEMNNVPNLRPAGVCQNGRRQTFPNVGPPVASVRIHPNGASQAKNCGDVFSVSRKQAIRLNPQRQRASVH